MAALWASLALVFSIHLGIIYKNGASTANLILAGGIVIYTVTLVPYWLIELDGLTHLLYVGLLFIGAIAMAIFAYKYKNDIVLMYS